MTQQTISQVYLVSEIGSSLVAQIEPEGIMCMFDKYENAVTFVKVSGLENTHIVLPRGMALHKDTDYGTLDEATTEETDPLVG